MGASKAEIVGVIGPLIRCDPAFPSYVEQQSQLNPALPNVHTHVTSECVNEQ